MSLNQSNNQEFGINRTPSPHTKQEHVDHLMDEHGISSLEGANSHRLRLLHGAAHQNLMGHPGEHLHGGDITMVSVDEDGNLRAMPF